MLQFFGFLLFYFVMMSLTARFVYNSKAEDMDEEIGKCLFFGIVWPITVLILTFVFIVTYRNKK